MNVTKLRDYITRYKGVFEEIDQREIYKWRAIKIFQNEWDLHADDFPSMLSRALSETDNLMDSGNYFPRRMIVDLAKRDPFTVQAAFQNLFEDTTSLIERMHHFQNEMTSFNKRVHAGNKAYQDARAVMVYLSMRFPESYYLYKFGVLQEACFRLELDYRPVVGADQNIIQHLNLCEFVRNEILEDYELRKMHYDRLTEDEYPDPALTVLTQDIVFAITNYLDAESVPVKRQGSVGVTKAPEHPPPPEVSFTATFADYAESDRRNRHIGVLGELLLLEREKQQHGTENVIHVSQSEGDGAGYDIRSIAEDGGPLYIEVKTTVGDVNTPFEVTRNELKFSKLHSERYILYRVYKFSVSGNSAKMYTLPGDLRPYCDYAIKYRVHWSNPTT